MYIEGNALILGDSSYLEHHGILGQKWGVRRFQNKDGTRTAAGKARDAESLKSSQEAKNVNSKIHSYINKQLSSEDLDTGKSNYDFASNLIKDPDFEKVIMPVVQDIRQTKAKYGNKEPYEFTGDEHQAYMNDIDRLDKKTGELAITIGLAEKGEPHKKSTPPEGEYERVDMFRYALARYLDEHSPDGYSDEGDWIYHTAISDNTSYLSHHGILGQKWGVRRFQNKDGTRTAAGKAREDRRVLKKGTTVKRTSYGMYDETYDNKKYVSTNDEDAEKWSRYIGEAKARQGAVVFENEYKLKRDVAVATGKDICKIIDSEFKNADVTKLKEDTDYAARALRQDLNNMSREERVSLNFAMQTQSGKKIVKLLKKHGYGALEDDHGKNVSKDPVIILDPEKNMKRTRVTANANYYFDYINHTSIDDSPHLSHHGIRGQKWGVRRFQNRDGSLTNAGRKRLGYATKGATQAVKKAFKAGTKTGAKAVKAVKAHYKKAEEKKIEKKKEKASKTRLGVAANKDLFTAKELKELNAKFEEQDKLTMARIKRGVEIANSVGAVAKSAGEVGKAYEALTGHKLIPDIITLQNGGSIDFNNKDKGKDTDKDTDKGKDKAKDKDDDPPKPPNDGGGGGDGGNPPSNQPPGKGSNWTNTPPDLPTPQSKSKWGVRKKDSDGDSDLQSQIEAVKKQASKAMKNAKLQEYIDAYNHDQNSEKNKELTARGQKAIEILSKGGGFTSEEPKPSAPSTPKSVPSSNNLMAQIRAAQTKLEKPNKNETPAEHKEAQEKLNALEKVANEYKAAANKPGIDSAEVAEKLLKKNKDILDSIKHMDFGDDVYLEHYGVRGMKWGKHLMAGKGGGIYDGTSLGAGGGGGAMTEEERKKAEELRKKKLEKAKEKAEEAAKEKEIEEKAKEIGISAKAYKRYSIDNNHLPGKRHYDKSQKLHGEASSSLAETQAAERQAHMNRAKAASLMRKVNSSHMFDADGYHISQQRGDDRKEAKHLRKEVKQLDAKSKKALKKFYKKRYKADKERQKWQNSTSGKYHHLMRHYEIQNGVLFIDSSDGLTHHGVKGQRWGVRRFQNEDGSLTPKGRKHYEKKIEKLKRKQVSSDAIRGTLERQHPFAVTGSAIAGAIVAGMSIAATGGASAAAIAAGSAISAVVSAGLTHATYSVSEAWEGRGTRMRSKKIAKYENMLKQSDMEEGMYHVENGTLFINAGEPYLEHHGVKGMKWGKHLMAGKGEAGTGGGGGEDDEKLKEMAKKAGMSVAEFRTKMAGKIGGAASNVEKKLGIAHETTHKPKEKEKSLDKRLEEKLGVTHETINKPKQSKEAKRIEGMLKDAARQNKAFSGTSPKEKKRVLAKRKSAAIGTKMTKAHSEQAKAYSEQAKAYSEQAKAKKEAAAKAKVPKMNRDPNTPNPFGSYGVSRQDDLINSWADDINRNNKMTRSGWRRKVNYEQPKKEFEKAAQDIHNGKKNVTLSDGAAAYALAREQQAVRRRRHSATIGSRDEKKAKELEARAKREKSIANRYSKVTKRSAKKVKHFDDTNAIYAEGTRLVVNSKWG